MISTGLHVRDSKCDQNGDHNDIGYMHMHMHMRMCGRAPSTGAVLDAVCPWGARCREYSDL